MMGKQKRRDRLAIMQEILKLAKDQAIGISHIVYQANLNFHMAHKYLEDMMLSGLVRQAGRKYRITEKGCAFMVNAQVLQIQIGR